MYGFLMCCLPPPNLPLLCSSPFHSHLFSLSGPASRERQCWSPFAAPLAHPALTAAFGPTASRSLWHDGDPFGGVQSGTIHSLYPVFVFQPWASLLACGGFMGMAYDDPLPSSMTHMI